MFWGFESATFHRNGCIWLYRVCRYKFPTLWHRRIFWSKTHFSYYICVATTHHCHLLRTEDHRNNHRNCYSVAKSPWLHVTDTRTLNLFTRRRSRSSRSSWTHDCNHSGWRGAGTSQLKKYPCEWETVTFPAITLSTVPKPWRDRCTTSAPSCRSTISPFRRTLGRRAPRWRAGWTCGWNRTVELIQEWDTTACMKACLCKA